MRENTETERRAGEAEPDDGVVVLGTSRARGLQLTIEASKRRWRLGEHIVVHYVAKNVGGSPTSVSQGGDYRGGPRATRINVVATDASGASVVDPHPKFPTFGGLGGDFVLEPGEEFAFTVSLGRYRRFENPGRHQIAIAHDLGWSSEAERIPADDERWVHGEIEIVEPSVSEATEVLDNMQALSSDANKTVGKRARPFADFTAVGYPVYLPLLASRVETEPRALEGISSIPTVEATKVLLELAGHADPKVSGQALAAVEHRLPLPASTQRFDKVEHAAWVARTWDPRALGSDVRTLAESLLSSKDQVAVMSGARLLAAVATVDDADRVVEALDRSLEATRRDPIPYPEPRTAVSELVSAAEALLAAGVSADASPTSPGEVVLYILEHGGKSRRPSEYEALAVGWLGHDIPQLGALALQRTASPLEPKLRAELPRLLGEPHLGRANAACAALGKAGTNSDAHGALLSAMKSATDSWLVGCLHSTAIAAGISRDTVAKTWAARLDEAGLTLLMLQQLVSVFETNGHGSAGEPGKTERVRLKKAWVAWLREHAAVVRAGKRIELGDPTLTPDLFPPGFTLSNRAGERWPVAEQG
ncbi:MAG: hypothetical protein ACRBN8_21460 [Nannocystales bacterium]